MKQFFLVTLFSAALALTANAQVSVEVINGAGFDRGAPVAPASYAQVWGAYDGFPTESATSRPLPTTLAGVEVVVGGTPAPLYAVTPQVVAFILPQSATAGRHPIQVMRGGAVVGSGNIDISAVAPGTFFNNTAIPGEDAGGVRRAADSEFALPQTPATRGGAIIIALTGQGSMVDNLPADGTAPEGAGSTTQMTPQVYISGVQAEVSFSGLMPFFPGVWQINAVVPNESFISGRVPLVVTYNGRASNSVVFWVAE
jgi:uncharacterized protein (TIGR03437 family)